MSTISHCAQCGIDLGKRLCCDKCDCGLPWTIHWPPQACGSHDTQAQSSTFFTSPFVPTQSTSSVLDNATSPSTVTTAIITIPATTSTTSPSISTASNLTTTSTSTASSTLTTTTSTLTTSTSTSSTLTTSTTSSFKEEVKADRTRLVVDALPFILWKRLLIVFVRFHTVLMDHSFAKLEQAKRQFAEVVGLTGHIGCVKYPSEAELVALFGAPEDALDVMNLPADVVVTFETKVPEGSSIWQRGRELNEEELLQRGRVLDRGDTQNCIGLMADFEAREQRPFRVRRHTVVDTRERCTRCKVLCPFGGDPFAEHTKRGPWRCSECRGCFSLVRTATMSALAFTFGEQHSLRAYGALDHMLNYAVKRGFPEVAATCARALEPLHDPKEKLVNALHARRVGIIVTVLGHIQREALPNMEFAQDVLDLLDRAWVLTRDDQGSRQTANEWLRLSDPALSHESNMEAICSLPRALQGLVFEYLYYPFQPDLVRCVRRAMDMFGKKIIVSQREPMS